MIVFIEIPSSGGRAFAEIMRDAYGDGAGRLYPLPPHDTLLPDAQMDGLGIYFNGLKSFSSPVVRKLPTVEAQWPGSKFVTLLCHPVSRLLYSYGEAVRRRSVGGNTADSDDPFPKTTIEFAMHPTNANYLTRMLSNADAWEPLDEGHLRRAIAALDDLDHVLLAEHFALSLRPVVIAHPELRDSFIRVGANFEATYCPRYSKSDLSPSVLAALEQLNHLDMQLYDHAFRHVCGVPASPWPSRSLPVQPRFKDHGDGTVTDLETGLMWLQDGGNPALPGNEGGRKPWAGPFTAAPDDLPTLRTGCFGPITGYDLAGKPVGFPAYDYIDALNTAVFCGYSDWRLPNVNELASLIDRRHSPIHQWLSDNHFVNIIPDANYWTSTTCHHHPEQAWCVHMPSGSIATTHKAWCAHYILPVRGDCTGPRVLRQTGQTLGYSADVIPTILSDGSRRGQDGDLRRGVPFSAGRFTLFHRGGSKASPNEVIIDNDLGLAWLARPLNTAVPWQTARDLVPQMLAGYAGLDGWRLPTGEEIRSLTHYGCTQLLQELHNAGFKDVQNADYWIDEQTDDATDVWSFGLAWGIYSRDVNAFRARLWPVCPLETQPLRPE